MKLTALKVLQRPGAGEKPVDVSPGTDFDVADVGEAKGLIRAGLAKAAAEAPVAKPPGTVSAPAAPAQPKNT